MDEIGHIALEANKQRHPIESNKAFLVHLIIELITLIAIVGSIVLQVNQQYKYRFYESQLQTYIELVSITGQIASENSDVKHFSELKKEFYSIYYGKSQLFEGKKNSVKNSVFRFKKALELVSIQDSSISDDQEFKNLKIAALNLANSCSEELHF
jgi:predicted DNA-binding protein with PD1-like motif